MSLAVCFAPAARPYYRPLIMLRKATLRDLPAIERVMRASLASLGRAYYDAQQVDSAITWIARPDPQIIEDGTYFVVEQDGRLVACGGWSNRGKLYAGSAAAEDEWRRLDPSVDAARVRAMFVDPQYARRGLGRVILDACEEEARLAGFRRVELMATLSGEALYLACGYEVVERTEMILEDGVVLGGAKMAKMLA